MDVELNELSDKKMLAALHGCQECEVKINRLDLSKLSSGSSPDRYKLDETLCDVRTPRNRKPKEFADFQLTRPVTSRLKSKENGMVLLHRSTYNKNPAQCVLPRRHSGNSPSKKKENILGQKSLSETDIAKDDTDEADKTICDLRNTIAPQEEIGGTVDETGGNNNTSENKPGIEQEKAPTIESELSETDAAVQGECLDNTSKRKSRNSKSVEKSDIETETNPEEKKGGLQKSVSANEKESSNELTDLESNSENINTEDSNLAKSSKLNIDKKKFFGKNKLLKGNVKKGQIGSIRTKTLARNSKMRSKQVTVKDQNKNTMSRDLQQVKAKLLNIVNTILPDKVEPKSLRKSLPNKVPQMKKVDISQSRNLRNKIERQDRKRKLVTTEIELTVNKRGQIVTNKLNPRVLKQEKYLNNNNKQNNSSDKRNLRHSSTKGNVKETLNRSKGKTKSNLVRSKVAGSKQRKRPYNNNERENVNSKGNKSKADSYDEVEAALANLINGVADNLNNNLEDLYSKIDPGRFPSDLWKTERKVLQVVNGGHFEAVQKRDKKVAANNNSFDDVLPKSSNLNEVIVKRCIQPDSSLHDRLVCVKNNLNFYIKIDNDTVNLIGAPEVISDIEDLYVLMQIVDETNLNSFNIDKNK